jgi:hypothetical protein
VKEEGKPDWLVTEVGDQDFGRGLLAEESVGQILFCNRRFAW